MKWVSLWKQILIFLSVPMPVGSMLVMHNHFWLHGRDKFVPHPDLCRELLRQRGHFTS